MNIFEENLNNYYFSNQKIKENSSINNYIVGKNGCFKHINNNVLSANKKIDKIDSLPSVNENISFNLPKIPFELFSTLREWFKRIYTEYKTESTAFIVYDYNKKAYDIFIPNQKNSGAASKYEMGEDPEYIKYIKDKELVIVAHSHPWASTSTNPSGIDDNDEKEPIFYLILGNVEKTPTFYFSTILEKERVQVELFDVFENPLEKMFASKEIEEHVKLGPLFQSISKNDIFNTFIKEIDIPYDEWKKKATISTYSVKSEWGNRKNNIYYSYNAKDYSYDATNNFFSITSNNYNEWPENNSFFEENYEFKKTNKEDKNKQNSNLEEYSLEEKLNYLYKNCDAIEKEDLDSGKYSVDEINMLFDDCVAENMAIEEEEKDNFNTLINVILNNKNNLIKQKEYIEEFIENYCPFEIQEELTELTRDEQLEVIKNYKNIGYESEYSIHELSYIEKVLYCKVALGSLAPNEIKDVLKLLHIKEKEFNTIKKVLNNMNFPMQNPIFGVTLDALCEVAVDILQ